jgi:ribosomal protein S18 acetylase RimI-like enzyme
MSFLFNIKRVRRAIKSYGFSYAFREIFLSFYRPFSEKTYLFYANLSKIKPIIYNIPSIYSIDRIQKIFEIEDSDLYSISSYLGDFDHTKNMLLRRFNQNAILWIFKIDNNMVGYKWSARGFCIDGDYYFPLLENDIFAFDIAIFPKYRGQGIGAIFTELYFQRLKSEGTERIFIGVKNWNSSSLSYIRKTRYTKFGIAKKFSFIGRTFTIWYKLT